MKGEYLGLRALAEYSGQSVRSLRKRLADPVHPLPHFRIGGKIFVKREDYDRWAGAYRVGGESSLMNMVDEVMASF